MLVCCTALVTRGLETEGLFLEEAPLELVQSLMGSFQEGAQLCCVVLYWAALPCAVLCCAVLCYALHGPWQRLQFSLGLAQEHTYLCCMKSQPFACVLRRCKCDKPGGYVPLNGCACIR